MSGEILKFPDGFTWGAATSAYQIEGAFDEDGKGPSIWDAFCRRPGHVHAGESGDLAADHYHRWPQDIELMKRIGLKAYRFSIAWTRILPEGRGAVNPAGLDFYDRLIDALLAAGITPYPTLFHYDLPQTLQDQGGWTNRETAKYFAEYAHIVGERLGDRAGHWLTHNEPWVTAILGYLTGEHAPGSRNPFSAVAAVHNVLLSHGLALQALRASVRAPAQIGIALNLSPAYPATPRDGRAVRFTDGFINRIILDPLLKGRYPEDFSRALWWRFLEWGANRRSSSRPRPEDLKLISAPLDFVGVNYYTRAVVRYVPIAQSVPVRPPGSEYSEMWEIYPPGIYDLLVRLKNEYNHPNWVVSENGVPVPDKLEEGRVHDDRRIAYLRDHIAQVHRALAAGVPVTGYFVWSLLDNFEWAYGYTKRFGLVYVDFKSEERTLKDSALWYAQVIKDNQLQLEN